MWGPHSAAPVCVAQAWAKSEEGRMRDAPCVSLLQALTPSAACLPRFTSQRPRVLVLFLVYGCPQREQWPLRASHSHGKTGAPAEMPLQCLLVDACLCTPSFLSVVSCSLPLFACAYLWKASSVPTPCPWSCGWRRPVAVLSVLSPISWNQPLSRSDMGSVFPPGCFAVALQLPSGGVCSAHPSVCVSWWY